MIYLDNAATSLHKPECVINAITDALKHSGNSGRGTHSVCISAANTIFEARYRLASFFGASRPNNIAFTSNSTEALNTAISGLAEDGCHIITTEAEHNSVLRPLYRLEAERNVQLSFVRANSRGLINYEDFEHLITDKTRLIVTTHASNLTGNLFDIKKIADIAHKHNLIYIVDASQSAGSVPIDIKAFGTDVLCFTGHKSLLGPQGTGGLVIRDGVSIRPLKTGGTGVQSYSKTQPPEMPTRLEAGTLNTHGIAGLSAAIDYLNKTGVKKIHDREMQLTKLLYSGLKSINGVKIYGDFSMFENEKPNVDASEFPGKTPADILNPRLSRMPIVSFNIKDSDSSSISDILAESFDIASRPGAHCAPLMHKALGTVEQGAVRFSISYFNTEEEIYSAVDAVKEIANGI